jgi:hypothetical protein
MGDVGGRVVVVGGARERGAGLALGLATQAEVDEVGVDPRDRWERAVGGVGEEFVEPLEMPRLASQPRFLCVLKRMFLHVAERHLTNHLFRIAFYAVGVSY